MATKKVKLVYLEYINYCVKCGIQFVVYYVDEENEMYSQAVDICPYCGTDLSEIDEVDDIEWGQYNESS